MRCGMPAGFHRPGTSIRADFGSVIGTKSRKKSPARRSVGFGFDSRQSVGFNRADAYSQSDKP
jgi:hypothetical protein